MKKLVIEADAGNLTVNEFISKHIAELARKAGIPIDADQPVFIRTTKGVLGYMLGDDGMDGKEHVFTWVTNEERLTGEKLCNKLVESGPGYAIYTNERPAIEAPTPTTDEDEEL